MEKLVSAGRPEASTVLQRRWELVASKNQPALSLIGDGSGSVFPRRYLVSMDRQTEICGP